MSPVNPKIAPMPPADPKTAPVLPANLKIAPMSPANPKTALMLPANLKVAPMLNRLAAVPARTLVAPQESLTVAVAQKIASAM